jgi:predicted DsbA family dithiol-disulfide isomerase
MAPLVRLDVWSDYVCPFCYLEEPIFAQLLDEFGNDVDVNWQAFELRPEPVPTLDPDGEYLHTVWNASVYPMASERGMNLKLPPVQPRSRRAFELAEFARDKGRFDETHRALFKAFFEDGKDISDLGVLEEIAELVGVDPEEAKIAIELGTYRKRILDQERRATTLGISAVPTILLSSAGRPIENTAMISGAQPYEVVQSAVKRAVREARDETRPLGHVDRQAGES